MPVQPTYPGVYIEEIPSGVHTITGVATSITAFIGRALRGPVNEATTIESYADFERIFGGLWLESTLGHAVQDFYLNGGSQAVIVRLFYPTAADLLAASQTIQNVLSAVDTTKPSKPASLADAMRQVADNAQSKAGRLAGEAVAGAAETEAKRTPTTASVRTAAQNIATKINTATKAVVNAKDTTSSSTPQTLSAAMRAVANSFTTDPEKTVADLVAKAAETAAGKTPATTDDVNTAAKGAADAMNAAAQDVANIADTTNPSTPTSLAAAMRAEANKSAQDPAKTAADLVAKAAEAESNMPTLDSVKQAAQKEADTLSQNTPVTKAPLTVGRLPFVAAYEGQWSENLRATIDFNVTKDIADAMGVNKSDLFNLTIRDTSPGGPTETYQNLTVINSSRRVDTVLEKQSQLLRWNGSALPDPTVTSALAADLKNVKSLPTTQQLVDDDITAAEKQLALAKKQLRDDSNIGKAKNVIDADKAAVAQAQKKLAMAKAALVSSDGEAITENEFTGPGTQAGKLGLYALERVDLFNLLCIPPYLPDDNVDIDLVSAAAEYCQQRRAMLLVDAPSDWTTKDIARNSFTDAAQDNVGTRSNYAALFFPRIMRPNPLRNNQLETFAPSGAVAGIFARTDAQRGVWKAPAGLEASLVGVQQLSVNLTDPENGELNPLGINCLRSFPIYGRVVWGSRTLRGADQFADEYKYIPVRRTALFIEESLYRGTQWVVFEPNDEPLWAQIRLNVGAFMQNLFRQGAFQGQTPRDAYLVKCDSETTTQNDINLGIVNILVAFAPLKPAEFVIIQIQQLAGQIQV